MITGVTLPIACVLMVLSSLAYSFEGSLKVSVRDEKGRALAGALVRASFERLLGPGQGWGFGRPDRRSCVTGADGVCVVSGDGDAGVVSLAVLFEGEVRAAAIEFRYQDLEQGVNPHWLPRDANIEVSLRRKAEPGQTLTKSISRLVFPGEGKPYAFDLLAGDWVIPFGVGIRNDIVFQLDVAKDEVVKRNGREYHHYDKSLTIDFTDQNSGVLAPPSLDRAAAAEFCSRPEAPQGGYQQHFVIRAVQDADAPPWSNVAADSCIYFRTLADPQHRDAGSLFGKIDGSISYGFSRSLEFVYQLNLTPGRRELDY